VRYLLTEKDNTAIFGIVIIVLVKHILQTDGLKLSESVYDHKDRKLQSVYFLKTIYDILQHGRHSIDASTNSLSDHLKCRLVEIRYIQRLQQ